jgi:hypothetical protein
LSGVPLNEGRSVLFSTGEPFAAGNRTCVDVECLIAEGELDSISLEDDVHAAVGSAVLDNVTLNPLLGEHDHASMLLAVLSPGDLEAMPGHAQRVIDGWDSMAFGTSALESHTGHLVAGRMGIAGMAASMMYLLPGQSHGAVDHEAEAAPDSDETATPLDEDHPGELFSSGETHAADAVLENWLEAEPAVGSEVDAVIADWSPEEDGSLEESAALLAALRAESLALAVHPVASRSIAQVFVNQQAEVVVDELVGLVMAEWPAALAAGESTGNGWITSGATVLAIVAAAGAYLVDRRANRVRQPGRGTQSSR